ncbi:MAG: hypothetical protein ACRERD_21685 [Candidatus Binatia bacterium]
MRCTPTCCSLPTFAGCCPTPVALEALLCNCPEFVRTAEPVTLTGGALIRGIKTLPLVFTAR